MCKYRIVKHTREYHNTQYEVQKKSFLGFWYNFNNFDAYTTGLYEEEADARLAISMHRSRNVKTVIDI